MATSKTKTKKPTPKWRTDTHPVHKTKGWTGRRMSLRDARLFTVEGKRRKGTTATKIDEAYGKKPKKVAKRPAAKKTGVKKPAAKKTVRKTTARSLKSRRAKPKGKGKVFSIRNHPKVFQRYVIIDGSGNYQSSHRTKTLAKKRREDLLKKHPRKVFRVLDTKG